MNTKKISYAIGGLGVLALAMFLVLPPFFTGQPDDSIGVQVVARGPAAFGSLANASAGSSAPATAEAMALVSEQGIPSASEEIMASSGSPAGLGMRSEAGGGGGVTSDMMIAPPMHSYTFAYGGEDLPLSETELPVYRRTENKGVMAQLGKLLAGQSNGLLDLSRQGNVELTHFQLIQKSQGGLSYNVDLREGRLFINPAYEEGYVDVMPERPLTIADMPADAEVIAITNTFVKELGVDLSSYGEPVVDQQWRDQYIMESRATAEQVAYVPHFVSVIYPLLIDGQTVYEMSGNPTGISVQVNVPARRVTGLSNLLTLHLERSAYKTETDFSRIVKIAEDGGMYGFWYPGGETTELQLGTPNLVYVVYHHYDEATRRGQELYVPAMQFPVTNTPEEYYGTKSITVPLVKEILDSRNNDRVRIMPTEPMPLPEPLTAPTPEPAVREER